MSGQEVAMLRHALDARANADALLRPQHRIAAAEQPVAPEFRRILAQHYLIRATRIAKADTAGQQ